MTEALSLVRILINTEAMIVIVLYHDEKQHLVHKTSQFWNMKNETNVLCANLYSVYKTRAKTEPDRTEPGRKYSSTVRFLPRDAMHPRY